MPFKRLTLTELRDFYETEMSAKFGITTPLLKKSVVRVLAYMWAGADHLLYGVIEKFALNAIIDTAKGTFLERWATIWGLARKPATYAKGNVTFTGIDSTLIPAGTTIKRADGEEFTTDSDGTISGGSAIIPVTATLAGANGNTAADSTLSLSSPIPGIDSDVIVDADGIKDGAEKETDDQLRARLLNRIQRPPQGGSENDFVQWALDVPAVTRAWCIPNQFGLGTVGVTFVEDDNPSSIVPSPAKVQEVADYIDPLRPVTAAVTVYAPEVIPLDITVNLLPNTAATQASSTAELKDMIDRETKPGGTILLSEIETAISIAEGVVDRNVISPTGDVPHAADEIAVLGDITFGDL
jgi:uncharacterized phage protein gp47/JayE